MVVEFKPFAPEIPLLIYYGSKEERADILRKHMAMDTIYQEYYEVARGSPAEVAVAAATTERAKKVK